MDAILTKLYLIAAEKSIRIDFRSLHNKLGFALCYNGGYAIAIDYERTKSEKEEKQVVAEEIAHCITNTLYPVSALNVFESKEIVRAEKKAQDYASTLLVALETLTPLLNLPYYEIAEELDVEEKMVIKAIEYYVKKGMLNEY